jgi:cell division protein ZapA
MLSPAHACRQKALESYEVRRYSGARLSWGNPVSCTKYRHFWYRLFNVKTRQELGMSTAEPVDIQILGRVIRVNCPEEQKNALFRSADELNKRLQELKQRSKVTNTEQLALIVALNMANELELERRKTQEYAASMEQRIRMLQSTIEQALVEQGQLTHTRHGTRFE